MSSKMLKLCACYAAVKGRYSGFIETMGASGTGKSYEDELVLSCFDKSDIVRLNDITYASLCDMRDELDKKIIFLGDLGNTQFSRMEKVFDVFKILCTEDVYTRRMVRRDDKVLHASSICIVYESVKRFVRDEQIRSRTACFSTEHTDNDLLRLYVQKKQGNDKDKVFVREYREKIKQKRQLDVYVEHDFLESFASEVEHVFCKNKVRKLEQLLALFEAYVILDSDVCESCTVTATREQYNKFIELVRECNFLSDTVEAEFVQMIQKRVEAVNLDILIEDEFGEAYEDIDEKTVLSVLYRKCGFGSRSKLYAGRDVFFSRHSLRKFFWDYAAWRNVDNVDEMLRHLHERGVVGILGSFRGSTVYYLVE